MQLPFTVDLSGKVAVVTGGGGVLCGEMSRALAACGAKVAVLSRRLENAERVAGEITEAGNDAVPLSCDVTDPESIDAAVAAVEAAYGPCDLLVNGAGGNDGRATADKPTIDPSTLAGSFYELDPEGFRFVFNLNLLGTIMPTQAFTKNMVSRGGGSIINISSMSAYHPLTKVAAYSAAKASVNSFTEWLAAHLAPANIRVNAIAPGFFLTKQNHALLMQDDGTPTPRGQQIVDHTPMQRLGEPAELTGALLWLASDAASSFVTGTVVAIDGGFNAFGGV
jgi:NAD(P)-dependent dehydrogenase (short-subunit alcohol dehydrogenase family)